MKSNFDTEVITYPPDRLRNYEELSAAVAHSLPESPFVIVAESFSGPVALMVAAREPPGLKAVILTASFVSNPRPWISVLFGTLTGSWLFAKPPPEWLIRLLAVGRSAQASLCHAVEMAISSVEPDVLAFRLEEVLRVDATIALGECPAPIYYLRGAHDRIVGNSAVELIRRVRPDVSVFDIPGPHLLLQACPKECVAVIDEIVQKICRHER